MDWKAMKDPTFSITKASVLFANELQSSSNPYQTATDLIEGCSKNCRSRAPKYVLAIAKELSVILEHRPKLKYYLDLEIKKKVLDIVLNDSTLAKNSILEKICQIYEHQTDRDAFYKDVASLVQQQRFLEACICASEMSLQNRFSVEEFAIPLFLQDKMNIVEIYLKGCRTSQIQFVQVLDSFCGTSSNLESIIYKLRIEVVHRSRLLPRQMSKLVSRLVKLFNIPIEKCPNLSRIRSEGALKFVLYKKYTEGNLNDDNWVDLVTETVGDNKDLQRELIVQLACYNDAHEVIRWAGIWQIPQHELPSSFRNCDTFNNTNSSSVTNNEEEEVWDTAPQSDDYLKLRLSFDDIWIIDTKELYRKALDDIKNYDCLGIDGEWKPCLGLQKSESKIALLQIATWDCVYLLDMMALDECLNAEDRRRLIEEVFVNEAITKLGFGFTSDIDKISDFAASAKDGLKRRKKMVDFALLCEKLRLNYPEMLVPCRSDIPSATNKTLTEITRTLLGQSLNKSEQFSNWERRPLREKQIVYAALDAFCLLQVYEVLWRRASDLSLDFQMILDRFCQGKAISSTPSISQSNLLESSNVIQTPTASSFPPINAAQFRVVVDTMLQGLGKQLRICGIDAAILEQRDHHDQAAKIARRDRRVILTSGQPYYSLKQQVAEGDCFDVPNGLSAKEQAEIVLKHYNVQIKPEDVFSRCGACNGNNYVLIPSREMKTIIRNCWKRTEGSALRSSRGASSSSSIPYSPNQSRIVSFPGGQVDLSSGLMDSGIPIMTHKLADTTLESVDTFYVCYLCGKVYWEGSHHGRVLLKLDAILQKAAEGQQPFIPRMSAAGFKDNSKTNMEEKDAKTNRCLPAEEYENELYENDNDGFYYGN